MPPDVEFATRLGVLAEVFGESLTPNRVAGYWAALSDLEPGDLYAAMDHALKTCRFFPRPAELRDHAESLAEDRRRRRLEESPVVPHYRRLEAGDVPVSPERLTAFLAELRQMVKAMPGPEPRSHGRRSS